MNNNFQDWQSVTINTKITKPDAIRTGQFDTISKNVSNSNTSKNPTIIDPEDGSIPNVATATLDIGKQIQTARLSKNMTQKKLDQLCNFPPHTVQSYENSKAVLKTDELNLIARHLGIKITRPKKK
jgi:ribosome-binding protein aMBF1 (putative translation factor)